MKFSTAEGKDRSAIEQLWDYCFEKRQDPFFQWFFAKHFKLENVMAGYQNGHMISCLHLMPYQLHLRGIAWPASYIVGLASFPEARGRGSIRLLLGAALREMRDRGHYLNILMPSKAGFYYPLQWELCYHQFKYVLPLEDLRSLAAAGGDFQAVQGEADFDALQRVYEDFVSDKHGYVIRDAAYWRRIIEEHIAGQGNAYLLTCKGLPAGYIFFNLHKDCLTVREMAWSNAAAQQALFNFLYHHRSQAARLEYYAPVDDTTYMRLPDPKNQVMLYPFMAGRVVDAAEVLAAMTYAPKISQRMVIGLRDELAPWNNQVLALEVFGGKGYVHHDVKADPEIQCDIGALSQLVFGRISAKDLFKSGRIETNFPGNIAKLDTLFPPCINYINEYY